jgi:hypothetical protein
MADTKITALTALTAADPASDVLPIVDISDTTMAASGTTKKISVNNILGAGGTATLAIRHHHRRGHRRHDPRGDRRSYCRWHPRRYRRATFTGGGLQWSRTLGDAVGDAITATGSFTPTPARTPPPSAPPLRLRCRGVRWGDERVRALPRPDGQNIGRAIFTFGDRFRSRRACFG